MSNARCLMTMLLTCGFATSGDCELGAAEGHWPSTASRLGSFSASRLTSEPVDALEPLNVTRSCEHSDTYGAVRRSTRLGCTSRFGKARL